MYLDDISLVPVELASADTYATHRLDPEGAALGNGAQLAESTRFAQQTRLAGPGEATWRVQVGEPGEFVLWAKAEAGARVTSVSVNGEVRSGLLGPDEDTWVPLGRYRLGRGPVEVVLPRLPAGPGVGRLVLTTDPGSSL